MFKYLRPALLSLTILIAGFTVVQAQGNQDSIYLPFISSSSGLAGQAQSETLTVEGIVRSTGAQMTSAPITLWSRDPNVVGSFRFIDIILWESDATDSFTYRFEDVLRLEEGRFFYVPYINLDDTPGFLSSWFTSDVGNPESGNTITIPTFDWIPIPLPLEIQIDLKAYTS